MKGDFSRFTFDPLKGYSRVLAQQGRVTLDADLNEQNAMLLHLTRTLGADLIGAHGGPRDTCAFRLIRAEDVDAELNEATKRRLTKMGLLPLGNRDALFGPGHYYVDGWLVEPADYSSYEKQPFLPDPDDIGEGGPWLVYLDVWERHVTMLEDAMIREVALGGPDTATRAQVVWQLRVFRGDIVKALFDAGNAPPCERFRLTAFRERLKGNPPRLRAKAKEDVDSEDPCVMPAEARYRGHENQLYRVEIHSVLEDGAATFKWSRENGSVVAPWLKTQGSDLIVSGIRDRARGFNAGDWVELSDDARTLRGEAGVLVQVVSAQGETLTIDPATASGTINADPSQEQHAQVRRWDQRATKDTKLTGGAIPVTESLTDWLTLEDGVQIQFQPAEVDGEANRYRPGDYWLIPARVATGDIHWPQDADLADPDQTSPRALEPHGVGHHYAPLWFIGDNDNTAIADLRRKFGPLAVC